MARSRNIKPGFFKNAELVELPYEYRLLFIGLWTLADRDGYLEDRPKQIKMEIFPADNLDIDKGLEQLQSLGFIHRYTVGESRFLYVCKFLEHQHPHHLEKPSIIPKPGSITGLIRLIPDSLNLIPEKKKGARGAPLLTFPEFLENVKASGEKAISDYEPVWLYADRVGIPRDWIAIAWRFFGRTQTDKQKKQKDWRRTFQNYLENHYLKLWYFDPAGQCLMTSTGFAEQKHSNAEAA